MKLFVLRGISGSGKSTKAKELMRGINNAIKCSADDYFMRNGNYEFNAKLLGQAHAWCRGKCAAAMELGAELIVIDNTATRKSEYADYVTMAEEAGYEVEIVKVGQLDDASLKIYANRNKHGVSIEVIRKQAARYEE